MAPYPPRKRACAAGRRSIGVTELSGLPGSEGYADCDDAESEGFLFVATKRNPSGVSRGCHPRTAGALTGLLVERPRSAVSPGRLSLVLAKESPPDPERKAALGASVCRGMVLSARFDMYRLVSLRFMPD